MSETPDEILDRVKKEFDADVLEREAFWKKRREVIAASTVPSSTFWSTVGIIVFCFSVIGLMVLGFRWLDSLKRDNFHAAYESFVVERESQGCLLVTTAGTGGAYPSREVWSCFGVDRVWELQVECPSSGGSGLVLTTGGLGIVL